MHSMLKNRLFIPPFVPKTGNWTVTPYPDAFDYTIECQITNNLTK